MCKTEAKIAIRCATAKAMAARGLFLRSWLLVKTELSALAVQYHQQYQWYEKERSHFVRFYKLREEVIDEPNGYGHSEANGNMAVETVLEPVIYFLGFGKNNHHEYGIQDHGRPPLLHEHIKKVVVRGRLLRVAAHISTEGSNRIRFIKMIKCTWPIACQWPVFTHSHSSDPPV